MNYCNTNQSVNENKDDQIPGFNPTLSSEYTSVFVQKFDERVIKDQPAIPEQYSIKKMDLNSTTNQWLIWLDHANKDINITQKNLKQKDFLKLINDNKRRPTVKFDVEQEIMNAIKSEGKNNLKLTNKYFKKNKFWIVNKFVMNYYCRLLIHS